MKTRFCPSPTGNMHLGNARTALFSALLAMHEKGTFLLRIEDTDKTRSEEQYVDAMLEDLRWLTLHWQEGVEVDSGSAGPYRQSERQGIYDGYYGQLEEQGFAYPCFCSEQQLKMVRKRQRTAGEPPRYPGTCRGLSSEEIRLKLAEGLKPTLRLRMPANEVIAFTDLVRGEQAFASNDIGDFVIRRTDMTAPFMYCNAIDDALMGVTHVFRGEDHLTNTPRQITILKALNLPMPEYGHITMIVGADGSPLSKRHGSRSVRQLREAGYLSSALVNYMARLGHYYASGNTLYDTADLAALFNIKSLGKAPARFDENQLLYWQRQALAEQSTEQLIAWMGKACLALVPSADCSLFVELIKANIIFPNDVLQWVDAFYQEKLSISAENLSVIESVPFDFWHAAITAAKQASQNYKSWTMAIKEATGQKGKQLFMPLRVALTGQTHGPELAGMISLRGWEWVVERLEAVS